MAARRSAIVAVGVLTLAAAHAPAAAPKDVDAAIVKGTDFLKGRLKNGATKDDSHGIGPAALAGIALLEAKTPATDPAVRAVAAAVREAAYSENKTYQLALCLIFLDRLEDPADVPLIQVLAVRLLAGQNARGGWTYECVPAVTPGDLQTLRAGLKVRELVGGDKPRSPPPGGKTGGKLHAVVEQYGAALWAARTPNRGDDNSNTQFAALAVWAARKHGAPVEAALDLIEKRFIATQNPNDGGWGYTADSGATSSPPMTCAGLIGVSVGVARREERRLKAEVPKADAAAPKEPKSTDPFFNPPPRPDAPADKKPAGPRRPADARDIAVQAGLISLGNTLAARARGAVAADDNLYFLWSLERVGVIYGVDKIGGFDWYALGSDHLVRTQAQDGSWNAAGGYGPDVNTAFAVLFLTRSNVARDLSSKIAKDPAATELRASAAPAPVPKPPDPETAVVPGPKALPIPIEDGAAALARDLVSVPAADWAAALARVRDAKGPEYTRALVAAAHRLDGDRKADARAALAERLARMSADTLRALAKEADAELRRGAVLACAMKDDKAHVPDLIDRLADDDDLVVRAARAGLKSLTAQDFGPKPGATRDERAAAVAGWRAWRARQPK